jgi:hypothetical protein
VAKKKTYTEKQWKAKYRSYEGDGSIPEAYVMVEWDDPNETPSEAIIRLNNEVMELVRRFRPVGN